VNAAPLTPGPGPGGPRPGLAGRIGRAVLAGVRGAVRRGARRVGLRGRWLWGHRPPAARAVAMGFCLLLAGLGAHGILFVAALPGQLPSPLDWRAAAALLERDARPGDLVALSPAWAERIRLLAPAHVPVRAAPADAAEDLLGVKRAWLVSLPDAPGFGWDAEAGLLDRAARNDAPLRLGRLEVTRYDVALPAVPLAFLPDRLGAAEVRLGPAACTADALGGFVCPGPSRVRVERSVREVGGQPRPCLVAPPDPAAGAPLAIEFRRVPVGRVLRGHAGVAGDPPGAGVTPVRISVLIDGEEAGAAELSGPGWREFQIDTARFAGRERSVLLVLSAAAPVGPLCLDAVTLR
jgi:hypothetical protein